MTVIEKLRAENSDLKAQVAELEASQSSLQARLVELETKSSSSTVPEPVPAEGTPAMEVTSEVAEEPAAVPPPAAAPPVAEEPTPAPVEAAPTEALTQGDSSVEEKPVENNEAAPAFPSETQPVAADVPTAVDAPAAAPAEPE